MVSRKIRRREDQAREMNDSNETIGRSAVFRHFYSSLSMLQVVEIFFLLEKQMFP
jgi:hypothetical protein